MKILITGSTGFVGTHLSELLFKQKHQLFLLARKPDRLAIHLRSSAIQGDLSDESIKSWTKNLPEDLDCVIHVAGIVHSFDIEQFYKINSEATKSLILNLKETYQNLHFVLISSLAAAGPATTKPISEDQHPAPVSHYGKSKYQAELYLHQYISKNWSYNIVRPPIVIGPKDTAFLDVYKMVKNGVIPLAGFGALKYKYSYICVFDLVKSIAKLADHSSPNETYFFAYPEVVTMKDILDQISFHIKPKWRINLCFPIILIKYLSYLFWLLDRLKITSQLITPDKVFELKVKNWSCDSSKSIENNFSYDWNLSKTIEVTYNDYHEENLI